MKTMKYNIAKLFAAAAALTLVVVGCSVQEENAVEKREVKFTASVGSFQVKATDTAFEAGDTIGLFADYPVSASNVCLTWQNGGLTPETPVYWGMDQLVDQSSLFYAYYPYDAQLDGSRNFRFTVKEDQSTHEGYTASDLMTAATYATPAEGTVNLNFIHRLSKLVITIDNQLSDDAIKEVYVGNVLLSATVDMAYTQDYTSFGEYGSIKACEGVTAQAQPAWSVIFPAQDTQPRLLIVTQSGQQYVYESQNYVYFSAARRHYANVILDETSIATTFSSTVTDWIDNGDFWFKQDNPAQFLGEWSVIGSIQGTSWDTDFPMQKAEDSDYVWYTTIEYFEGESFKFRMNGTWDVNFGLRWSGAVGDWWTSDLLEGGYDIFLERSGVWYVQIDVYSKTLMTYRVGDIEIQLDQIQPIVDIEDDSQVSFTQVVYALSSRGFVVFDGKYSILVYTAKDPGVQIGDIVRVSGTRIHYNNVPEVNSPTWQVLGHTDDLIDLTYMYNDVTSYLDQDFAQIAIPISIEGVVSSDGYTLEVADQTYNGNVFYPTSELMLTSLYSHKVRVSGFYNGRREDKLLVYIIPTVVEDLGEIESGYTAQGDGSFENPFNATGAYQYAVGLATGEVAGPFYIQGIISSVKYTFSADYGTATFFISDDGTTEAPQFQAYSVYYFHNQPWTENDTQIQVGDSVILHGEVTNYKGTPETNSKKAWIYSLNGWTGPEEQTVDYSGWSIVGDIYGTSWDTDYNLTPSSNPAVQYVTINYNEGEQFKFRRNGDWAENYGIGDPGTVVTASAQVEYNLIESGGNIQLESSGVWMVVIDLENLLFAAEKMPDDAGQQIEIRLNQEGLASLQAGSTPIIMADGVLTFTNSSSYGSTTVTELRIYKSQTLSLSVLDGYAITGVDMICSTNNPASGFDTGAPEGFTVGDDGNGYWSGSAQELAFTAAAKQVRVTEMTIKIAVL